MVQEFWRCVVLQWPRARAEVLAKSIKKQWSVEKPWMGDFRHSEGSVVLTKGCSPHRRGSGQPTPSVTPLPSPGSCHGSQHWQLGAGCTSPTKHCVVGILFSSATGTQLSDDCVWCSYKLPGDQTSLCENSGPNGINVFWIATNHVIDWHLAHTPFVNWSQPVTFWPRHGFM